MKTCFEDIISGKLSVALVMPRTIRSNWFRSKHPLCRGVAGELSIPELFVFGLLHRGAGELTDGSVASKLTVPEFRVLLSTELTNGGVASELAVPKLGFLLSTELTDGSMASELTIPEFRVLLRTELTDGGVASELTVPKLGVLSGTELTNGRMTSELTVPECRVLGLLFLNATDDFSLYRDILRVGDGKEESRKSGE